MFSGCIPQCASYFSLCSLIFHVCFENYTTHDHTLYYTMREQWHRSNKQIGPKCHKAKKGINFHRNRKVYSEKYRKYNNVIILIYLLAYCKLYIYLP